MSEKKPFPLELIGVSFSRTLVQAIPEYDSNANNEQLTPTNQVTARKDPKEKDVYWCLMQTVFNRERNAKAPYLVDIECFVKFKLLEEMSEEQATRGVVITGHNVAYGAIREAVNWVTSRHIHGPLVLGLSVLQFKTEAEAKADVAAAEKQTPPAPP